MTVLMEMTSADQLESWHELGATYPVLYDQDDEVARFTYELTFRPVFFLIDEDMTIIDQDRGPMGMENIERQALQLLNR